MVNDYERYRTRLARREVLRRIDAHTDVLLDGVEEAARLLMVMKRDPPNGQET